MLSTLEVTWPFLFHTFSKKYDWNSNCETRFVNWKILDFANSFVDQPPSYTISIYQSHFGKLAIYIYVWTDFMFQYSLQ